MHLPRISDTLLVNNIWLVGLLLVAILLIVWLGLAGGAGTLRWLFRAARIDFLVRLGDRLARLARSIAMIVSALSVLVAITGLSYAVWKEVDFQPLADRMTGSWTSEALWPLAKISAVLVALAIGVSYLKKIRTRHLPQLQARLSQVKVLDGRAEVLAQIFGELPEILSLIAAYAVVNLLGQTFELPEWLLWGFVTLSLIALVIGVTRLLVKVGRLALEVSEGLTSSLVREGPARPYYDRVQPLMPLARRMLEAVIHVAGAIVIIRRFDTLESFAPYGSMFIELIGVFFVTRVIIEVVGVLVFKVMVRESELGDPSERSIQEEMALEETRARRMTLAKLVESLSRFVLYLVMGMVMLLVMGVDPLPLLAGAGVVGFAVGLGSQKILEDIICGFFMLLEDQMLIGDYVKVEDTEGVVEELHLRVSRIRDRFGRVHTIRNSTVGNVINYSRGWTLAVVEMSVAYEADLPEVLRVMTDVGKALYERFPEQALGPAKVMGLEAMDDSCLRIRTETRVRPGCHYDIKRELNRMLFDAFVAHGLEIPYPKGIEFEGGPATPPPRVAQAASE